MNQNQVNVDTRAVFDALLAVGEALVMEVDHVEHDANYADLLRSVRRALLDARAVAHKRGDEDAAEVMHDEMLAVHNIIRKLP